MSKAKKILRRTLSGGALLATVAGLLWWNAADGSGRPLFWVTSLILIAAVIEVARMGSLAAIGIRPPLLLGAIATILLANAAIEGAALRVEYEAFPAAVGGTARPGYLVEAAFAALAALAVHGLTRSFARFLGGPAVGRIVGMVAVGAILVWALNDIALARANVGPALLVLALLAVTSAPLAALEPGGGRRLLVVLGLAVWLLPPLPALWGIWQAVGTSGLVALLALSKIGDTAGYYVGGAIGKSHPFPRISPGKTTAGCVASFVAATALGGALWAAGVLPEGRFGLAGGLLAGALLNVAAQAGDLLESWVKRRAGVKDSSNCFGPSGGLLDQLDSLLLSIPMALLTWPFLFPESFSGISR
ncbi:MAG: phosphatidate cytidylyltransferase [Planctomycetota bacterium]|nr:phosphatidate cytidylyltransferase [Planctomycetota bacterium]